MGGSILCLFVGVECVFAYLRHKDKKEQYSHYLIVVQQPEKERISAASGIDVCHVIFLWDTKHWWSVIFQSYMKVKGSSFSN